MGGSRSGVSKEFAKDSMRRSGDAFEKGLPLFQRGVDMAQGVISQGGEPAFLARALENAGADAKDRTYLNDVADQVAAVLGRKGQVGGGNTGAVLAPETLGAKLASFVAGSETNRQQARIGQIFDAAGVGLGQAGSAGEMQTRALSNQLAAISMRPAQDPAYTAALAAVNAGTSIYGAGRNAGWWGQPSAQLQPFSTQRTYASYGGAAPTNPWALLQPLPPARSY